MRGACLERCQRRCRTLAHRNSGICALQRFHDWLQRRGSLEEYMALLVQSFNAGAAEGVMCRNTVSVNWDGRLFDCDFNQQLDIPLVIRGRDETLRGCL